MKKYDEVFTFEEVFGFEFGDKFVSTRTINLGHEWEFYNSTQIWFKLYNKMTEHRAFSTLAGDGAGVFFVPRKVVPDLYKNKVILENSGVGRNDYVPVDFADWVDNYIEPMLPGEKYMLGIHSDTYRLGITFRWKPPIKGIFKSRRAASITRVKTSRGWELQYRYGI